MAKKIQTLLVDDLDGTELGEKGHTIEFGWLGQSYEIDLSDKNAKAMQDVLGRYVEHARRPAKASGRRANGGRGNTGIGSSGAREARAWLIEHGFLAESARGRISADNWERYRNRGQMTLEGSSTGGSASAESQMSTDETTETPARTRRGNSRKAQESTAEVETPESVPA